MKKIVVDAETSWRNLNFRELVECRSIFVKLIQRDLKLRYQQTLLGVLWVILQPLLTTLIFTIIFGKFMGMSTGEIPYALFAFCGLVPWLIFSQSLQRSSNSLVTDSRLITKVYFPRILVPLSATFGTIIDYGITIGSLFCLLIFYKIPVSTNLLFLPIASILLFLFSSGLSLFFSSVNIYYRDFKHILPFIMPLWMYASPIAYSASIVPQKYQFFYNLNPICGLIEVFRWTFLGLPSFPVFSFFSSLISSLLIMLVGMVVFRRCEPSFTDFI